MRIQENISLQQFNTFGFDVSAAYFSKITSKEDLLASVLWARTHHLPLHIIGGGSNLVLTENLPGLTCLMCIEGKEVRQRDATSTLIRVGAGEDWHDFVTWTLENDSPGLENLALIPGTCGAAPIQNIGAYGTEISEFIDQVEVLDTTLLESDNPWIYLSQPQCEFNYRHSIFKSYPGRFIVTGVTLRLPIPWSPHLEYADLKKEFTNTSKPPPIEIFQAVCRVRQSKLPDPKVLGNAGSFFQNPIVSEPKHSELKEKFPHLISYPTPAIEGQTYFKLAAGWLIDQCGFKGYKMGSVGVYDKQALVLIHSGGGTGKELLALAEMINKKIHAVYGVDLIQEPVCLP
jgi:UDP-N-acetylmuramate dehydrogenase